LVSRRQGKAAQAFGQVYAGRADELLQRTLHEGLTKAPLDLSKLLKLLGELLSESGATSLALRTRKPLERVVTGGTASKLLGQLFFL
jgi:hypothetical protein